MKKLFVALGLLLFCFKVQALEVSAVKIFAKSGSFYRFDMSFSGLITVDNCTFDAKETVFKFPITNTGGKSYSEISALGKDFFVKITGAAAEGKDFNENAKDYARPSKEVSFTKLKSDKRLFNADVVLDGRLKLTYGLTKRETKNGKSFYMVSKPAHIKYLDKKFEKEMRKFILSNAADQKLIDAQEDLPKPAKEKTLPENSGLIR